VIKISLIQVENVVAGYISSIDILNDLSLDVEKGKITIVLGPNGAGKSTLLKTIYGFLRPREGRVLLRGKDINGLNVEKLLNLGVAYVPQQSKSLFPQMTVHENLEMGCWVLKNDKKRIKLAINRAYEHHSFLWEARDLPAGLLSGGQQRILEVERSMLTDPEIILLDEPTETLAPKIAKNIYSVLVDLKKRGVTILIIDQNIRSAMAIADNVYILDLGKIKYHGSKEELEGEMESIIKTWITVEGGN
jgi:branched-chain amino acid transport system ATP-binding protein